MNFMLREFYLSQNRQEGGWVSLRCLAISVFPHCLSRRQDPSSPGLSCFPQSHQHLVVFVPRRPFLCVCGRAGVRGLPHILSPPFLWDCSSEFGWNSCPRYQLLLPEVCEYLWQLICFLSTMLAALLAFVLMIKTQFIIKTSILRWNWVLRIL